MTYCPPGLAYTGSPTSTLVVLALLLTVAGALTLVLARRRGQRRKAAVGTTLVIGLGLSLVGLFGTPSGSASADDCAPSGVAPAATSTSHSGAAPTGSTSSTSTSASTGPSSTTGQTSTSAESSTTSESESSSETSTTSQSTSSSTGTSSTTDSTTSETTTSTTAEPGFVDLTPTIRYGGEGAVVVGGNVFVDPAAPIDVLITITDIGTAATDGSAFSFTIPPAADGWAYAFEASDTTGTATGIGTVPVDNASWRLEADGTTLTWIGPAPLPAGAGSTVRLTLDSSGLQAGAQLAVDVAIPSGAGGDVDDTNNTASQLFQAYPDIEPFVLINGLTAGPDADGYVHVPSRVLNGGVVYHSSPLVVGVTNQGTAPAQLGVGSIATLNIRFAHLDDYTGTVSGAYALLGTSVTIDGADVPVQNGTEFGNVAGGTVNGAGNFLRTGAVVRTGQDATPLDPGETIQAGFLTVGTTSGSPAGTKWTLTVTATLSPTRTQMDVVEHSTTYKIIFD